MSKQMGVSRGPIREAMRTLEQEGLLYSHPYKETMIAEITGEEVSEVLIPVRLTLEQFTLSKALPLMNEDHYDHLRSIIASMRAGAEKADIYQMVNSDLAFHEYLVQLSGMSNMVGIWTSIINRIRLYFITQVGSYSDLNILCKEHEDLLEAIIEGKADLVAKALADHIHNVDFGVLYN